MVWYGGGVCVYLNIIECVYIIEVDAPTENALGGEGGESGFVLSDHHLHTYTHTHTCCFMKAV